MNGGGFPCLEAVRRKYADRGVAVLVANGIESAEKVAGYASRKEWGFTYLVRKERDMLPERLYGMANADGIFVIGRDGKILWSRNVFDATVEEPLTGQIEKALAK